MLQPLLDRWGRVEEVVEGGEMKMDQGHGLRLCRGLSVCRANRGNGGDVSPEEEWGLCMCLCEQAKWVLRPQSGVCQM